MKCLSCLLQQAKGHVIIGYHLRCADQTTVRSPVVLQASELGPVDGNMVMDDPDSGAGSRV